jgi:outer membrane protein OmpA-like peptidoglycan-associated protein
MTKLNRSIAAILVAGIPLSGLAGCASMSNKEKGAVIGATTGAAAGAVIGNKVGSTAKGAIIGAVVGGTAGAVIGHQMDQQAKELAYDIEGARVERVGEGIVVTFESGILYPFDSDQVQPAGRVNLQKLAESLKKYPNTDVLIVGHTDAVGTDSYNATLSQKRAAAAAAYLSSQGIDGARLHTEGRGEAEPIASNDSDAGRQENRRVEVAIFASEKYRKSIQ